MALNPQIMSWARTSAGLSLEDAARGAGMPKIDRLLAIESGEEVPSRPVLLSMAKLYRRSLLTFYLATPPEKGDRGEDFRTVPADHRPEGDALLDALIRDLRARQSLVNATLEDEEAEAIAFIGSTAMSQGVAVTLAVLKQVLKLELSEFRAAKKSEDAFGLLRARAEAAGVFVLLISNLGSHHSAIPVETFRGFAIADPIAPFIVINDQDAKTAWSFTLLHELAHLCLGTTGVSGMQSDQAIETFCNDVAGEFLLPKLDLDLDKTLGFDDSLAAISKFARARNLSSSIVAYKLFRNGDISRESWQRFNYKLRELWLSDKENNKLKAKPNDSGPSYYVVRRHRLGKAMLEFASRVVNSGALSPVKVARVLGVKPRSVYPLLIDIPQFGIERRIQGVN